MSKSMNIDSSEDDEEVDNKTDAEKLKLEKASRQDNSLEDFHTDKDNALSYINKLKFDINLSELY